MRETFDFAVGFLVGLGAATLAAATMKLFWEITRGDD